MFEVGIISSRDAAEVVIRSHYLHRRPPIKFAFGLPDFSAVVTFGVPPSRHLQKSVCPSDPDKVLELNRLWVDDRHPRNSESQIIAQALKLLPPYLVCSYADTAQGHVGYVYRATNWWYAGLTDQDRKTPRYDYVVEGKHSRDAFRCGKYKRIRRLPKHRYWRATGDARDRKRLEKLCGWPKGKWA